MDRSTALIALGLVTTVAAAAHAEIAGTWRVELRQDGRVQMHIRQCSRAG